jgi:hypothetical protein
MELSYQPCSRVRQTHVVSIATGSGGNLLLIARTWPGLFLFISLVRLGMQDCLVGPCTGIDSFHLVALPFLVPLLCRGSLAALMCPRAFLNFSEDPSRLIKFPVSWFSMYVFDVVLALPLRRALLRSPVSFWISVPCPQARIAWKICPCAARCGQLLVAASFGGSFFTGVCGRFRLEIEFLHELRMSVLPELDRSRRRLWMFLDVCKCSPESFGTLLVRLLSRRSGFL